MIWRESDVEAEQYERRRSDLDFIVEQTRSSDDIFDGKPRDINALEGVNLRHRGEGESDW